MNIQRASNINRPIFALTLFSALGSGLAGGVFFAFSSFVMKAFARLPPPVGIAAMQSVNISVVNPSFAFLLFGTSAACLFLAARALLRRQEPGAGYRLVGSLLYLAVTMLVTFTCNVPQNNALATVDPSSAEGTRLWAGLVPNWTAWNHVRTAGALGAAASFTIAIFQMGKGE
jgi:uncharacterized membrane protein